jgi:hypothetical protein
MPLEQFAQGAFFFRYTTSISDLMPKRRWLTLVNTGNTNMSNKTAKQSQSEFKHSGAASC